ncbi:hypothetical protein JB92DRAFT_2934845 [Gautieria morchelliformis]|nr:hypothetical protein JB92DRAFT_2934845 [Gautieria morchelliformis]
MSSQTEYQHFTDPVDLGVLEPGMENAEGPRALGDPINDFEHYTPENPERPPSTMFGCMPCLRRVFYPSPPRGILTATTRPFQTKYRHFTDPAEFAVCIPIIKLADYTPEKHLSTVFDCTPYLRGRLYPSPGYLGLFILDFIDHNDIRVLVTGLTVYDVGMIGEEPRMEIPTLGSLPECKVPADLYTLNPYRTVEITKGNQMLKRISFTYINRSTIKPIFQ